MIMIISKCAPVVDFHFHVVSEARMDQNALGMIFEGKLHYCRFHEGCFQFLKVEREPTRPNVKYMHFKGTWTNVGSEPPFWWCK